MRRVHLKMIWFFFAFVLVAGVGTFGAVYVLGGMSATTGVACCFDTE